MKKANLFFIIASIIVLNSCLFKQKKLDKIWFYTHTTGNDNDDDIKATPASFINLQNNGSYTRDFGVFEYGGWEKKGSDLVFTSKNGKSVSFPVVSLSGNQLQLQSAKGTTIHFEAQPGQFADEKENPFSIQSNEWRIPAKHKETESAIKDRLRNHFRFNEIYLKWAIDNEFTSLDIGSTPSLFKIYSNGFVLRDYEELPIAWRSYFYDKEDCQKANDIVKDIFNKHDIAWAKTDNRFVMFVSAYQQLQQLLNK